MSEDILPQQVGSAGRVSLNRPRALNALTLPMCRAIMSALADWREDAGIAAVMIDHAAEPDAGGKRPRGFCAGGDVAEVRRSVLEDGGTGGRSFFMAEYRMNHLLFTYPKPVITFMDGVTMGGGVGLAMPGTFRVATENTLFAMPEMDIGLFPDVGAGWYLSRLAGRLGPFLALTGARLDGAECLHAGLATHYLPSDRLDQAKREIAERPGEAEAILDHLSDTPPEARLARNIEKIDRLFASDRLEDILAVLEQDGSKWALKERATLLRKSPLSCKVALRQLAEAGAITTFAEEMKREYALAARIIMLPDFAEGVRAVLVDKDRSPAWHPATAEAATPEMVDALFEPLGPDDEWSPL